MNKRYGVIEVGTRGIRLLVADASSERLLRVIYTTGDLSNLGKEVDKNGNLSPKSVRRVEKIAQEYRKIANDRGASKILIIATEVVRSAPNSVIIEEALKPIAPMKILTHEEEAAFSFVASVVAFQNNLAPGSTVLVIDQGGGSTELTTGIFYPKKEVVLKGLNKFDLGTVALSKRFVNASTLKDGFDNVRQTIRKELTRFRPFQILKSKPPTITVGLGSAITIFAQGIILGTEGEKPRLKDLHGRLIKTSLIAKKIAETEPKLRHLTRDDLGFELTADSELTTLISGILTYYEIARMYKIDKIRMSRTGMRYGALLWLAGKQYQIDLDLGQKLRDDGYLRKKEQQINLNDASLDELLEIPNLGELSAIRIIQYRNSVGPFLCVDDIMKIKGVGAAKLKKLKSWLTIETKINNTL